MRNLTLINKYRETDRDLAMLYYRLHGENPNETDSFIPDEEVVCAARQEIKELETRIAGLDAPDFVFSILKSHFEDFLGVQKMFLKKRDEGKRGGEKKQRLPDNAVLQQEHETYRRELKDNLGVDLEELLCWYESEIEKTRKECMELSAALKVPEAPAHSMREVNDILFKYEGPAATAEEMFGRAKAYLKRTRAAAHACVWLPEDEICEIRPIEDIYSDSYPWGGYDDGGERRARPLRGHMFLNQHNFKNITDGWIKINTLHEAYPGHHVQWVRKVNDPIPATFKIGAKGVPLSEGTCIRTERVFQTTVFSDDAFYPLFVAYRRHHGSVRIKVDLMLRWFGKTIGEAVKIYQEELGLDYETARMQVQAHENACGYFTCYYYGLKKLEEWEKQYGYDPLEFTALLFDVGEISIANFGKFLALTEEDKFRLTHDYASMIDFR